MHGARFYSCCLSVNRTALLMKGVVLTLDTSQIVPSYLFGKFCHSKYYRFNPIFTRSPSLGPDSCSARRQDWIVCQMMHLKHAITFQNHSFWLNMDLISFSILKDAVPLVANENGISCCSMHAKNSLIDPAAGTSHLWLEIPQLRRFGLQAVLGPCEYSFNWSNLNHWLNSTPSDTSCGSKMGQFALHCVCSREHHCGWICFRCSCKWQELSQMVSKWWHCILFPESSSVCHWSNFRCVQLMEAVKCTYG